MTEKELSIEEKKQRVAAYLKDIEDDKNARRSSALIACKEHIAEYEFTAAELGFKSSEKSAPTPSKEKKPAADAGDVVFQDGEYTRKERSKGSIKEKYQAMKRAEIEPFVKGFGSKGTAFLDQYWPKDVYVAKGTTKK